ncbi:ABC-F family ATP-binding cassette domain-containing protein [Sporolactobacillus sp. THM19-2]|uniref:ABC-F family ATP-binding cassette domain-containing protein n=1 Tax=Sporolactobacillus sp. THM19-2 TaxID=2511171 RepID=UPI001021088B|nr:ABC-F family ATP-binding cassette domain-containing protein [Sporolactobacillus sp. THM19-2]RYL88481.1 ABC transporter ATP-binding protein [Sporolactobacillus sp. THM19-2]
MILLQTNGISKSFAAELILSDINIEVKYGERVALVGRNGAGKSTLLKIIAGVMRADSGEVIMPKDRTMGYLPQNATLNSTRGIFDELQTVFEPLIEIEKKMQQMEKQMSDPSRFTDDKAYNQLLKSYDTLQAEYKAKGGYTYQAEIRSVLNGLNFADFPDDTPVNNLSGGQKTQLALGKLLLLKPDLLILDEPTNHLDIETLNWLENYLQRYPGSILVVSHDQYFMDKIATKVYEVVHHTVHKYDGNYTRYLELRAAEYENAMKRYDKQQKEIERLNDFVRKNIVRASTTRRAQSRRKQLEKMDIMDKPRGDEKSAAFSFDIEKQSGNDVLSVSDLSVGYSADSPIVSGLHFRITRGERVALVGPNGIGKSTILKSIAGGSTLISGHVQLGSQVTIGYYDQEQTSLIPEKTVLNELWDDYPLKPENEIRNVLGGFLFSGDDVKKLVAQLSGGEKARLLLAKLMMRHDNLLILDEPTNHLDLDSKEVLEAALMDYPGTILFVSHDRYFINHLATRTLELSREGITEYLGNYDYYVDKKEEQREIEELDAQDGQSAPAKSEKAPASSGKQHFLKDKEKKKKRRQLLRTIEQTEKEISGLEADIDKGEKSLLSPAVFNDTKKAKEVQSQIDQNNAQIETLMERWESDQQELENLGE